MSRILREGEVTKLLRISRTTLWKLRKEGKIPYYKVGNSNRYDEEEVLRAFRIQIQKAKEPRFEPTRQYRAVDLFAGIGGIRLGFEQAFGDRIRFVWANDNDENCKRTYEENFGANSIDPRFIEDVRDEEIPDHDILLAGFPCQPFSMAGEKKGFNDKTRGTLFYEIRKILKAKRPCSFMLENVAYFEKHDGGRTWTVVKEVLEEELDYKIYSTALNAKFFGVPQNRPRFFVVGFSDRNVQFDWPQPRTQVPVLKSILEKDVAANYYLGQRYLESLKSHRARHEAKGHGFGYLVLDVEHDVAHALVVGGMGRERNLVKDKVLSDSWKLGDDKRKKNNEGIRRLTPRECARLQGFPDSFRIPVSDTQAYKQFANSVPVPVVRATAKKMLWSLDRLAVPLDVQVPATR